MKYISHFDPSIGSGNLGDEIITSALQGALHQISDSIHLTRYPTQLKINYTAIRSAAKNDISIIGGSNLLCPELLKYRQWKIGITEAILLKNIMLFGVGWHSYGCKIDSYSAWLYRKILNNRFLHSVRDDYTKEQLHSIGITNVINTGCPSLWSLTPTHCQDINTHKMDSVVFTLSAWRKNLSHDITFIKLLAKKYDKLYFWPQGRGDIEYFNHLNLRTIKINVLPANLDAFDEILSHRQVDYIGVRLHGGIRALHHKCRSFIISVDNRSIEMKKDFNIPVINYDELDSKIDEVQVIDIKLDYQSIDTWSRQFKN